MTDSRLMCERIDCGHRFRPLFLCHGCFYRFDKWRLERERKKGKEERQERNNK